ncbi:MAG: formyltransferase family protein [Anaerolineae bacterium]
MARLRVLFFGMEGIFSRAPLAALLDAGHDILAVVVPRSYTLPGASTAPRLVPPPRQHNLTLQLVGQPSEPTIIGMAWATGIPVLEIGRPTQPDTLAALAQYAPGVICVACFPYLLPRSLLAIPEHGGFNIHPSLLPEFRGPSPLFWVYRAGLEHAGVTVHRMDAGADTGDIAAQQSVEIADGTRYSDAERLLSRVGGELLVDVLDEIAQGNLQLHSQTANRATSAPTPSDSDYIVATTWPARRAFNFIHGLAEWEHPFTIALDGKRLVLHDAAGFDATQVLDVPVRRDGDRFAVRFSPGVLHIDAAAIEDYP